MNQMNYMMAVKAVRETLPPEARENFDLQLTAREKNPVVALVLGLFLGCWGIDRFYCGSIGLGVLKLLTLGGCGILAIIDWFLIMGVARRKNLEIANQIKFMIAAPAVA